MITTLDTNDNDDAVCFFSKDSYYCDRSFESIIVDIPSENPIVAANLPLVLDRPRRLRLLRNVLLGVAAIHQSFLLSRSSVDAERGRECAQTRSHLSNEVQTATCKGPVQLSKGVNAICHQQRACLFRW